MFAGPVCHFELVRIARRGRTFAVRFAFGLFLLGAVGLNYSVHSGPGRPWYSPGDLTISEMSELSEALFLSFMATLLVLVLGLTPGLVADAIATERQSKTLHYLLASRLSSAEIILGKLFARLINVGVFPVLVLPVVSLLTLLGGVSPPALVLGYTALGATAYFLAGLALLVSVLTRRAREAVGIAYMLTAAWLFVPPFLQALLQAASPPWTEVAHWILFAGAWAGPPTPLGFLTDASATLGGGSQQLAAHVAWMAGMQVVYGTLFVLLAAWQLRPAFRRHEGRAERRGKAARFAQTWFPLRPCGDDPVFWKEAYFAVRAGGLSRNLARAGVFGLLALVLAGALYGSADAFRELWQHGYGFGDFNIYQSRMGLNFALRYGTPVLFVVWMLWLGGVTAAGISSEREQDTWISLLSTPLEAGEILRGKMLGPLRATAHFGVVIVALWIIGLLAGAVHPLGLLNALVVAGLYAAFMIALGTYASFKCQSTWRARLWTQGLLVGPHVCCLLPLPSAGLLLGVSLWSYAEINELWNAKLETVLGNFGPFSLAVVWYFGGLVLYGGAAYFLASALYRQFDRVAGRPQQGPRTDVVLKEWKGNTDSAVADDAVG
ncbi:MAG: ABC transporter permease subunit [Isosphaeraceae bacterium]|nr:ABC transporter permease subunit [Isosphaeraceae bacterium]